MATAGCGRLQAGRATPIESPMNKKLNKSIVRIARDNGRSNKPEPVDLRVRVRELRKARKWTLQQAASQAGLARSTLSKIERGQMSPTYDALKKLATGLEISVPQLFTPLKHD